MKNKKIFYFVLFGMAVICYFFANNRSFSKMVSSNVEALVSVSNSEYHTPSCGLAVEEFIETADDEARYLHYTDLHTWTYCSMEDHYTCDKNSLKKAIKSSHTQKCYHPQPLTEWWQTLFNNWPDSKWENSSSSF